MARKTLDTYSTNNVLCPMKLTTLILAAGIGKRMNSDLPKVLHPVNGKPMVRYCLELSNALGSERTIVIIGYKKELVVEATKDFDVEYVLQDPPKGTGHAVQVCEDALSDFDGDILVLYGDVPLLTQETMERFIATHREEGSVCTVLTAVVDNPFNYGRVIRREDGLVAKIIEEKDCTPEERKIQEINSGIYVFRSKELFDALHKITASEVTGEYYLTSVFDIFSQNGQKVCAFVAENSEEILGVNNVEQLNTVENIIKAS
jgi:bifunctional UDP-N-acetylglucosamine pyrophosphorylase / glucosamine-1-phosphate N-acetyltransferase